MIYSNKTVGFQLNNSLASNTPTVSKGSGEGEPHPDSLWWCLKMKKERSHVYWNHISAFFFCINKKTKVMGE